MQRLAHGTFFEKFPQACGLGAGAAIAHQGLLCVKSKSVGGSSTGSDSACGTGSMPKEVGFRDNCFAYAPACFVACTNCCDELLTAFVFCLADSQRWGNNNAGRMNNRRVMQVIKVQTVRGSTVDKGCVQGTGLFGRKAAENIRLWRISLKNNIMDDAYRFFLRTADSNSQPVQQTFFSHFDTVSRKLFVAQFCGKFC